ncbi:hypothetical protein EDD11_006436 [Mortierella claussenii]|nr:hypothetical protein EDD11_006436 [Mortierella claussenii]
MDGISFLSYTNGEAIPLSSIEFGGIMDTGNFAQAGETDTDDLFSQFLDVERWPLSVAIPHCTIPVAHCFEANASGTEGLIRPAELHASSVNERLEELRRHEQQQHLQLQFQGNPQAQGGLLSHNCCGATRGMIQQHHLQKQQRLSEPEQLSHLQQGLLQQVQYTPFHQLQTGELDSHMQVEKQLTVIPSPLDMAIVAMETDQEQYIQSYPQLLPNATLAERFQQPSYILYSSPATSSTSPTCFSPMSSPEMSSPMIEQGRLASEDNMCHSPVPNILAPMVALTGQIHAAAIVRNPTLSSPVSRMQVESIESSFQQASMSVIVTSSRASQQGQQQRHDAYLSDSDDSEAMFKKTKRRHVRRPKITSKGQSKPSVKLQV